MSASTTPTLIQEPEQSEYSSNQRTLDNNQHDHLLPQLGLSEDDGERPPLLHIHPAEVELPIQQHHSPKSKKKSILREWWSEIAMSAFSILLMFAIATLLYKYRDRPAPSWSFHLNMNSTVAILSTFLRSSLFMILGRGLFQYNWTSFITRSADESNDSNKSTEVELAYPSPSSSASTILRSG